jgi:formiminotetrahydrofolate cyclodeaminase
MGKLIELSTVELLGKFGSGNHKPGSGSAAAFHGLVSAQLIRTVIELSKQRPFYKEWLPDLNRMEMELENRIYQSLLHFFQLDSEQFDRVIQLRRTRDDEKNTAKKRALKQELDDALLPAIETPIAIAKLCAELAGFAVFLCDHGFQSARGDSGVALNNAIAAIAGCLSIINLNLLSLGDDEQTEQIRMEAGKLKATHVELSSKAMERLAILEKEAERHKAFHKELKELSSGRWVNSNLSYAEIEGLARRLQNTLYKYHDKISRQGEPENVIDILKPEVVLTKILNYDYKELSTLGQHIVNDEFFEIAGFINKAKKTVRVSKSFSKETQNFTAAHELGHALLHQQSVLHRDRAVDGSAEGVPRDITELQADKFATFFLMPEKQVKSLFKQLFLTDKFVINENTVFALTGGGLSDFRRQCKELRDLSRILASAEFFGDHSFKSMAELFNVSKKTMAIRLEELQMVAF